MEKIKIYTSYQLDKFLNEKYKGRIETDSLSSLMGGVNGKLDSKPFRITFKGEEYLLISTAPKTKDVLDELLPVLTDIMGEQPICSYDLQSDGLDEQDALPTIEWDVKAPEKRIKEIVNGRAFSDGAKILNLKLYNGNSPADYSESDKEKEDRIKNAKIYGVYLSDAYDKEKIDDLDEVKLYLAIDSLGGYIWRCRHEMSHGRMDFVDLTDEQYALEYMVYQTKKFGVEVSEPKIDRHITTSESYRVWFDFYDNHFKNILTREEWDEFQRALALGLDTSKYMPSGSWKDSLKKDNQKTIKPIQSN